MKTDKSKRTVLAMLCLYLAIGIVAALLYYAYGSRFVQKKEDIDYTFVDRGQVGEKVEINNIEVLGESGANDISDGEEDAEVSEDTNSEIVEKHFYSFVVSTKIHRLRIRQEPDLDGKIIGYFQKKAIGYILIKGNEWSYVTDGKNMGYCYNEYLDMTEIPVDELPDFYPEEYKTINDEEINY